MYDLRSDTLQAICPLAVLHYSWAMGTVTALPLFHLYGDPPDDQAFDFIHIETIASRSSIHDWTILAHRHRNLFQILLIEQGGGEMIFEARAIPFEAPCAILVPPTTAHGFRFQPAVTDGWVISFTEDAAEALGDRRGEALARLKALAFDPLVPLPADHRACRSSLPICTRNIASPVQAIASPCVGSLHLLLWRWRAWRRAASAANRWRRPTPP